MAPLVIMKHTSEIQVNTKSVAEEVGHDHVHSFFAELAQLIDRIFYVNF